MKNEYKLPKYTPTIGYNSDITAIETKDGKYTLIDNKGERHDVTAREATLTIIGIQMHYLLHKGRISDSIEAVNNPLSLTPYLTNDGSPSGKPILSASDTLKCFDQLTNGMLRFNNKKCLNYKPAFGIGCISYMLLYPYLNTDKGDIYKAFYTMISQGSFGFQMRCKAMARSFYKGVYTSWPLAKKDHDYFFSEEDFNTCYDNILDKNDVFDDPIHYRSQYPMNLFSLNVDGIIITYSAASLIADKAEQLTWIDADMKTQYQYSKYYGRKFYLSLTPYYKMRAEWYNHTGKGAEHRDDPVHRYNNGETFFETDKDLNTETNPHLVYLFDIIVSDGTIGGYEKVASKYSHEKFSRLDHDCPILGDILKKKRVRKEKWDKFVWELPWLVMLAIFLVLGYIGIRLALYVYHWGGKKLLIFGGFYMFLGFPLFWFWSMFWDGLRRR
jgi:hypothetical protein